MKETLMRNIQRILQDTSCEALLITDPFHLRYLSGFRGGEGMLYLSGEKQILITDSRYTEAASKETDFEIREEKSGQEREKLVAELLQEENITCLGYEDVDLRCATFAKWQEKLPAVQSWVPLGKRIENLRRIKTEQELEWLACAEAVGDEAFTDILGILRPGMTEREVAAELEYSMKKHGADDLSFSTIVASGENGSMPHAVPSDRKIEMGDLVTMDFGCIFSGYCSDMTRTVAIGSVSEKQREIYELVLHAQTECLEHLHAGMRGSEADAYARDPIVKAGYGAYFGHGTGHSVGLYIHEDPRISPRDDTVLEAGMVETVEPGIYLPGEFGVRIEDMVVVTEDGCRNLSASPKELLII